MSVLPASETLTGSQLDEQHVPETNGRMPVCRRCGSQTDSPVEGHHMPTERQMARIRDWLVTESRRMHLERARQARER